MGPRQPARPAGDERGPGDRDLQGGRACPRRSREQFQLGDFQGTHALGHTRMATESRVTTGGLASVLDRARPLPRPQRLALEPQPAAARSCAGEGIEFQTENDTEVAAGYLAWRLREGATLEQALEGMPRRPRRLLHLRWSGRPTASRCCATRSRASPPCLAETDDWVAMSSEWRAIAVLPGAADARLWEPEPGGRLRLGEGARLMAVSRRRSRRVEVVDLRRRPLARARTSGSTTSRTRRGRRASRSSTRTALTRSRAGSTPRSRSRSTGHVGYYCAGMNKLATVRVHGNASTGHRREHDVGHVSSSTGT